VSRQSQRDLINGVHLVVTVGVLCAAVLGAHYIAGLSDGLAVIVGGLCTYVVATAISRRLLPRPPVMTDEERLHFPQAWRWFIVAAVIIPFVHFVAGIAWIWSVLIAAVCVTGFVAVELVKRSQARRHLEQAECSE
jgi:hypothetical protein